MTRRTRARVLIQRAQGASYGALSSSLDTKEIQEHKILIFYIVRARLGHVESAFEARLRGWLGTRLGRHGGAFEGAFEECWGRIEGAMGALWKAQWGRV